MFMICSNMTEPAPSPNSADEADVADAWERALLDRQLEALGRLAEMGLAIAGAIERRATAEQPGSGPDTVLHHAALDFARGARAVRMTFALQSRLIADFKNRSRSAEAAESDDVTYEVRWAGDPSRIGTSQKRAVQGIVRQAAEAAGHHREAVERLAREAGERLERDDIYSDIMTRPINEIVALICQDLGLELTSPIAQAMAGRVSPVAVKNLAAMRTPADPGVKPTEERWVEGTNGWRTAAASPVRDSS
jgi:hypothetical protein